MFKGYTVKDCISTVFRPVSVLTVLLRILVLLFRIADGYVVVGKCVIVPKVGMIYTVVTCLAWWLFSTN